MGGSREVISTTLRERVSGKELRLIEHECNAPTRSRKVVVTSWVRWLH